MLRALDPHLGLRIPLYRCDGCLGIWASHETVAAARQHYHAAHYVMVEGHGRQACRSCGHLLSRGGHNCGRCRAAQRIACARCERSMTIVLVAGVTIDICKPCKAAWFDRGELGLVARAHAAELAKRFEAGNKRPAAETRGGDDSVADIADVVEVGTELPDLAYGVARGAQAAGELAVDAVEGVPAGLEAAGNASAAAGQAAIDAASAAGDLAVETAEALFELLGGIFD